MNETDAYTITDEQIHDLLRDALADGDQARVDVCWRALTPDYRARDLIGVLIPFGEMPQRWARGECARRINDRAKGFK